MTKSDHDRAPAVAKQSPPATAAWGTWEELLLAYAVNRYGTESWASISSELQKRSSDPIHFTPHHCEQKYGELKRRFNQSDGNDDAVTDDGSETTATTTAAATATAIPWLEELRNLRVLELQRELQNYDLYISSLQSKVKKLTEESEKTGGETKENSDLGHGNEETESEKADETAEPVVSGDEDFDRDNQSVNGSNGNLETAVEKSENENGDGNKASPVGTGGEKPEPAVLQEGREPVKTEPGESPESIAESKSEGKNSDVQSSASKSRKEANDWVPRGSIKMDDQDQSTDSIPVRSLPLVDFMQKVQKLGSVLFERRLDRQEKLRYKNLIRQHIDYDTLQTRLKEGWYSDGNHKFFRDLLLLVNNSRIFFPKQSPESTAAVDLRQLILNEMITIKKKQKTNSKPANLPPKRPTDPPKLSGSIAVCRKRSSINAKAVGSGSSSGKKEQADSDKLIEENPKKSQDSLPLTVKKKGKSPVNETAFTKPEKKKKLTEAEEKKQSAAKFLNRMKRSNEALMKSPERGGDRKKEQAGKTSSRGKEQGSPEKRNVGRPPKRLAATPPVAAVSGKRNRESIDSERLSSKPTKKRSKR
ncbi:hypothetical protein SSX86_013326 [Deinandra increscens subsp. villosa]|uniref:Bromo domain-containing protein n=1 Tax=Deinandra increscens subsp. villosa TaxID=3103831 RepID=A0AAP0H445_9ASTR